MHSDEHEVFPVALNLRGRSVLVLGGADEATEKVPKLIAAGARVRVVAPRVSAPLARLARTRVLDWYAREFSDRDVQGTQLVFLTEIDSPLAERLRSLAARTPFWLCAIDQPAHSDLYLVSSVRSGPVTVSISTGGEAPLLARRIRLALEQAFDGRFGEFARKFASLRSQLRPLPRAERTARLTQALDGFAMEVHVRYPDSDSQGAGDRPVEARGLPACEPDDEARGGK